MVLVMLLILLATMVILYAGDVVYVDREEDVGVIRKVIDTSEKVDRHHPTPKPVRHTKLAKATLWTIDNIDTVKGYNLTGWSKSGLDSNLNPWYLKVGVISGRTAGLNEIKREEYRKLGILEDWHRTDNDVAVGIHFGRKF